jgi:histidine ammonia-lyase
MAMTAAWKLRRVVRNVQHVIAIELMCAAQGVEYRRPLRAARAVEDALGIVRELVAPLGQDRVLAPDIAALAAAVAAGRFTDVAMATA